MDKLAPKEKEVGTDSTAEKVAVITQFAAAVNPNAPMQQNYLNAISFLQSQDAGLAQATQIFARMSELKAMSEIAEKDSEEMAAYEQEFQHLLQDISDLRKASFNGNPIFPGQQLVEETQKADISQSIAQEKAKAEQKQEVETYTATIVITEATEGDKITASVNGQAIDSVTIESSANDTAQELAEAINSSSAGVVATAAAGIVKVESEDKFSLEAKAIDAETGLSNGTVSVEGPGFPSEESEEKESEEKKPLVEENDKGNFQSEKESPPFRLAGSNDTTHEASFHPSGFSTIVHWSK